MSLHKQTCHMRSLRHLAEGKEFAETCDGCQCPPVIHESDCAKTWNSPASPCTRDCFRTPKETVREVDDGKCCENDTRMNGRHDCLKSPASESEWEYNEGTAPSNNK